MDDDKVTFGTFLEKKRKEQGVSLRGFAAALGIAAPYLSDIEKGRRYPPDKDKLDEIAERLHMSVMDRNTLLDLAAMGRENTVSLDLPQYIMSKDLVRVALRKARDTEFDDWQQVIDLIEKNKKESK